MPRKEQKTKNWTETKFRTIWYCGNDSQIEMVKQATIDGLPFYMCWDAPYTDKKTNEPKHSKKYGAYESIDQFVSIFKSLSNQKLSMYEMMNDRGVSMFADLEWKPLSMWSIDTIKLKYIQAVNHTLVQLGLKPLVYDDIIFLSASDKETNKGSLHAVCHNYHFNDVLVHQRFNNMVMEYLETLPQEQSFYIDQNNAGQWVKKCFIDPSVYTKIHQLLRTINSYKIDDGNFIRPFVFEKDTGIDWKETFVSYIPETSINISSHFPILETKKPLNTGIGSNDLQKLVDEYGLDDEDVKAVVFSNENGSVVRLSHNKTRKCPLSNNDTRNDAYLWVSNTKISYRCHEECCEWETHKKELILWQSKDISDEALLYKLSTFTDRDLADIVVPHLKDVIKIGHKTDQIYVYNEKTRLWIIVKDKESKQGLIKELFMDYLIELIKKYILEYREKVDELNREISVLDQQSEEAQELFAEHELTEEMLKKLTKGLYEVKSNSKIKSVISLALHTFLDTEIDDYINLSPDVLPIGNNIIHLDTGVVRPRVRTDYFTCSVPVEYTPKANNYENVIKFMSNLTKDDEEYLNYLKLWCGYCLTGRIDDRKLYIAWGNGFNGKSSFVNLMKECLGQFYQPISKDAFAEKGDGKHKGRATPELIPLQYARLAVFSESDKDTELDEVRVKNLTGDDDITVRKLFGEQYSFKSLSKLMLPTNHLPKFNTEDKAVIDRLAMLPFTNKFSKDDPVAKKFVKDIRTKHINECFSWMVDGAIEWYKNQVFTSIPQVCSTHLVQYIKEFDYIGNWLESECEYGDYYIVPQKAYESFTSYCHIEGIVKILSNKDFGVAMKNNRQGVVHKSKKVNGVSKKVYVGIRLKLVSADEAQKCVDEKYDE